MSVNATNPGTLFGGTWQQIQGRFLLAAGGGYSAGATGGEASHTLTAAEMPAHSHTVSGGVLVWKANSNLTVRSEPGACSNGTSVTTSTSGGNTAHNNMPPYLAVYVWKRTA